MVRRFGGSVACSDAAEAESGERRAETEGGEWRDVMGQNEQNWTQQRERARVVAAFPGWIGHWIPLKQMRAWR